MSKIIMGGYGSGRWGDRKPDRKPIVENCRTLDVNNLVRAGVIRQNAQLQGAWQWRNEPEDEQPCASVGFEVRTDVDSGELKLRYALPILQAGPNAKAVEAVIIPIRLVTSNLPTNGHRWWFICPAQRSDRPQPCRQRVGVLYLPAGGGARLFACRDCYDLTYKSCRESRSYQSMFNSLGAQFGISGRRVRRILERGHSAERKSKERLLQRAVFRDAPKPTDVPSTPMDSVH
jgi:hypothetical protein